MSQTVILSGTYQKLIAKTLVDQAPPGSVVTVSKPKRTVDQNSKMWAMLSDISRAKPGGRNYIPKVWKCVFMSDLGYQMQIVEGLNGEPVPIDYSSSRLTRSQMSDLIELIYAFGSENFVLWSEDYGND